MNTKIIDPKVTATLPHKYLGIFGMIWITFLLTSMLTAVKTFDIFGLTFSAQFLLTLLHIFFQISLPKFMAIEFLEKLFGLVFYAF